MKKLSLFLLAIIAIFTLAACGSEELTVELSETFIELELGENSTIIVTTNLEIDPVFLSLNNGVATVTETGTVNSVGVGSTNIRVTVGEIVETVTVKVVPVPPPPVVVEDPEVILTAESVRDSFNDVVLEFGTSLNDAIKALPKSTIVYDDAGNLYLVDLTWVVPNYDGMKDPHIATEFTAIASFSLPEELEPGNISFEVSLTVSVLPIASAVALNTLNRDPNSALLSTFEVAGVKEVTATNLNAVKAALVVAKNVTFNPGWSPSDIQAVVDNVNLDGGTYSLNVTFNEDGSLDYLELSTDSRQLFFDASQMSAPLSAFFELNRGLLNGQKASFDIGLSAEGNFLNRINYLELVQKSPLYQNIFIIPSSSSFNNLTVNGLNQNFYADFVIEANNVTFRNIRESSVITTVNASTLTVLNAQLRRVVNTLNTTLNVTNVTLTQELTYNPFTMLNYNMSENQTLIELIGSSPYFLFNPLLVSDPKKVVNSELGFLYTLIGAEFGFDLFSGFLGDSFETREDVLNYLNQILELSTNVSNAALFFDEEFFDIFEILFLVPTVESITNQKLGFEGLIEMMIGEYGLNRYIRLLESSGSQTNLNFYGDPITHKALPKLTLNGTLEIDTYVDMIGNFDGLSLTAPIKDSEIYIYQGSYVKNFSFDNNITIETGLSDPLDYFYYLFDEGFLYAGSLIILENGDFYNGLIEVNSESVDILFLGTIDGNGAQLYNETSNNPKMNVYIGASPDNTYYGEVYLSGFTPNPGQTTINNLDLSNSTIDVFVAGENNVFNNVTLNAIRVEQESSNTVLTLNDVVFVDAAYLDVKEGHVEINESLLLGSLIFFVDIKTSININEPLTIEAGETLDINGSGTILGLENLVLDISGSLLSGQTISTNINPGTVLAKWQVATEAGVYTDLVTNSSVTLSVNEVGKTLRLVLVTSSTGEEVVLETLGLIALDVLDVETSSVSLESELSIIAGSNVIFEIDLNTSNNLDVISVTNVSFIVSSGGVVLTNQTLNVSSSATLSFAITEAGLYEDITVYVSQADGLSAFTGLFDVRVNAATPNAISVVSPTDLTEIGAGASYDIKILVTDIHTNPVPNAVVSLSAIGLLLDSGSGFVSETMMTGTDGTLTATLNIDPVALPKSGISLVFEIEEDSASITGLTLFESVGANSSAEVIDQTVVAGDSVEIAVTLVDTKGLPQAITPSGLTLLLVDGVLGTGTVIATTSAVTFTSTTGTAVFAIDTADDYDLNLYVSLFPGSDLFVLVQEDLTFKVIPAVANSIKGPEDSASSIDLDLGSVNALTFTLEDAFGNHITDETVTFELTGNTANSFVGTSNTTSGTLTVNANGEYIVNLTIANNEVFADAIDLVLLLKVSGTGITYPLNIDIQNTLDATASSVNTSLLSGNIVAGDDNVKMVVTLVNVSGDAIDTDILGVYIKLSGNTTIAGVLSGTGVTREAIFTITDTSINTDNIQLFVETSVGSGKYTVIENDIDLKIVAATAFDIMNLTSSSIGIIMPGDTFNIAFNVVDEFGNPVEGESITVLLEGRLSSGTIILGSISQTSRTIATNNEGFVEFVFTIGENEPIGNSITFIFTSENIDFSNKLGGILTVGLISNSNG